MLVRRLSPDNLRMLRLLVIAASFLMYADSAVAQPASGTATVLENAPIYLLPDRTRTPLRTAAIGSVLDIISVEDTWVQVRFRDPQLGPRVGYIEARFVRRSPQPDLRPTDLSAQPPSSTPSSEARLRPRNEPATAQSERDVVGDLVEDYPDAGTTEIVALGSVTGVSADGEIATHLLAQALAAAFVNRYLEIGGALTAYKLGDFDMLGAVGAVGIMNFPTGGMVLPYVGGGAGKGFGYSEVVGNPWYVEVEGGFRILTPRRGGALVIRPFYQRQFFSGIFGEGDLNTFGLAIGASVLF